MQLAEIGDHDRVLDVGAGTGYSAAVLARLAKTVVALEMRRRAGRGGACRTLRRSGSRTCSVVEGDLADGWADEAPYDAIVLEGSVPQRPDDLLDQLKDGGRLVAVVRATASGKATIWRRLGRSLDSAPPSMPRHRRCPASTAPVFAL